MKFFTKQKIRKLALLFIAGTLSVSRANAHRIEYYTTSGCVTVGQNVTVDAYVTLAPSSTRYSWQYKGNSGAWTCLSNGTNNINGTNFTVSGASGSGEDNAPLLTIANATAALDNVQLRCLMRESTSPCGSGTGTIWGGDDAALNEVKMLRLKVVGGNITCSASCADNLLTGTNGFYGGFEAGIYNNGSFTDKNFISGAGSTDFSGSSYDIVNNPYAFSTSFGKFAPHSGNYQMVIKGNTTASTKVWYKTINVEAGAVYSFSVWVAKVDNTAPKIRLKAGNTVLNTVSITGSVGAWQQVSGTYTVPSGTTSVTFAIYDNDAGTGANNYTLDDICLVMDSPAITIGDKVWYDANRNGRQDNGESGVANTTVELFADANNDNIADSATPVQTTTTNTSGIYAFNNVVAGSYFLKFTVPSGYSGFTTQDANGVPGDLNSDVNVTTGKTGTHMFTADYLLKDAGLIKNITLSGTVWNDVNGNVVKATPEVFVSGNNTSSGGSTTTGGNLYVNLIDVTGEVIQSVQVSATGAYSLDKVPAATSGLKIQLTTVQGIAGNPQPATALPTDWVATGDIAGTNNTATQSNTDNIIELTTGTNAVTNQAFGIERIPTPVNISLVPRPNPGGFNNITLADTNFKATDPDNGIVTAIRIVSYPSNVTSLRVKDTTYYATALPGTCPSVSCKLFPAGGLTIPTNANGNPNVPVLIDPMDGNVTVDIKYTAIDNAGKISDDTAKTGLPFTVISISGIVWDDGNGDVTKASPEVFVSGTNAGSGGSAVTGGNLYVNLLDAANNLIQSVQVSATGAYTLDKVPSSTSGLKVQLSVTQNSTAIMPTNWVPTGEIRGTNNTATQSSSLSVIEVTTGTTSITGQAFGIEQLPTPVSVTLPTQNNPGGTNNVAVADTTFKAVDADGSVTSLKITGFPSNITSITVKDTTYYVNAAAIPATCPSLNCKAFPPAGLVIPTNANGSTALPVSIDPVNGDVMPEINYIVTDNAGKQGTVTATAKIPLVHQPDLTPVIRLMDPNFGPGESKKFTVRITELYNKATSAPIAFNVTVPLGYVLSVEPGADSITLAILGRIPVSNRRWSGFVAASNEQDFLADNTFIIQGNTVTNIGFTITRTTAISGSSANIVVNIYADPTKRYDSNPANNLYNRIITAY